MRTACHSEEVSWWRNKIFPRPLSILGNEAFWSFVYAATILNLLGFSLLWDGEEELMGLNSSARPSVSVWQHNHLAVPSLPSLRPSTCHNSQIRYVPTPALLPDISISTIPWQSNHLSSCFTHCRGGGPGGGSLLPPFVETPQDDPKQSPANCWELQSPGANVKGVPFHLLADPAAFLFLHFSINLSLSLSLSLSLRSRDFLSLFLPTAFSMVPSFLKNFQFRL